MKIPRAMKIIAEMDREYRMGLTMNDRLKLEVYYLDYLMTDDEFMEFILKYNAKEVTI